MGTVMVLATIVLSKVTQSQKDKNHMFFLIWGSSLLMFVES